MAIRWLSAERLSRLTGKTYTEGRWIDLANLPPPAPSKAPMVMRDVSAYQSMVTGQMIDGRAQHREHLKAHDLVEIGNEGMKQRISHDIDTADIAADLKRAIEQGPAPGQAEAIAKAASAEGVA